MKSLRRSFHGMNHHVLNNSFQKCYLNRMHLNLEHFLIFINSAIDYKTTIRQVQLPRFASNSYPWLMPIFMRNIFISSTCLLRTLRQKKNKQLTLQSHPSDKVIWSTLPSMRIRSFYGPFCLLIFCGAREKLEDMKQHRQIWRFPDKGAHSCAIKQLSTFVEANNAEGSNQLSLNAKQAK